MKSAPACPCLSKSDKDLCPEADPDLQVNRLHPRAISRAKGETSLPAEVEPPRKRVPAKSSKKAPSRRSWVDEEALEVELED